MRKHLSRILATALISGSCLGAMADEVMIVNVSEGEPIVNKLDDIAKIAFGDTGITIVTPSGSVELAYAEVGAIRFDLNYQTTAVQTLRHDAKLTAVYAEERINIKGAEAPVDMAVFSVSGRVMMADKAFSGSSIDVSSLPAGAYLAKINNMVIKFVKK